MEKLLTFLTFLTITLTSFAQSPEGFNYQAVIRDVSNNILSNQAIGMQLALLQGSPTGTVVYTETHNATTDTSGLVTLTIGTGITSDVFTDIDWANGSYFLEIAADITGGTTYSVLGTQQLLSVPYALYAKTSGSAVTTTEITDIDTDTKIQVEESADEDAIRFDVAGTEQMNLNNTLTVKVPTTIYKGQRNALTLRTTNNALETGIAFRNAGSSYSWSLFREHATGNPGQANLVFAGGVSLDDPNNLTERMRISNTGKVKINDLSGSGVRMVLADDTGVLSTQPITTGGDITQVNAGDGLIGGGTTGAVTLDVQGANGLTETADDIGLGGTLDHDTDIDFNGNNLDFHLDNTGNTFRIFDENSSNLFDIGKSYLNINNNLLRLNFSGNRVGINMTPTHNLTVAGAIRFTNLGGNPSSVAVVSTNAIGVLTRKGINTIATTSVIAGNGLVGGGTVGDVTLDVVGTNGITASSNKIQLGGTISNPIQFNYSSGSITHNFNGSSSFVIRRSGQLLFTVSSSSQDVAIHTNLLYADKSTDRLGVGTNAPDTKLHVQGDTKLNGTTTIGTTGSAFESLITHNAVIDLPEISGNTSIFQDFTISNATVNSTVHISVQGDLPGNTTISQAYVTATDMVRVKFYNPDASAVNPASMTFRFTVINH